MFNKKGLKVKSSALRFYRVILLFFCYHEEYFLINKTRYKLFLEESVLRCPVINVFKQTAQFKRKKAMQEPVLILYFHF